MSKVIYLNSDSGFQEIANLDFDVSALTALRLFAFPNKSGTVACVDDVNATNFTGTLPITKGGTGQTTQQLAVNALAGGVTSGQFLRGNGTNVTMSAIQASDLPTTTINAQAGNYTAALTDANNVLVDMTSASANIFTIPTNASVAFAVGSTLLVTRSGAGVTTIQATAGVTLNGTSGGSKTIDAQYQAVTLIKKAIDTWYIFNK